MAVATVPVPEGIRPGTELRLRRQSGRPVGMYLDQGKVVGPVFVVLYNPDQLIYADQNLYELLLTLDGRTTVEQVRVGDGDTPVPDLGDVVTYPGLEALLAAERAGASDRYADVDGAELIEGQWRFSVVPLGPDGEPLGTGATGAVTLAQLEAAILAEVARADETYLQPDQAATITAEIDFAVEPTRNGASFAGADATARAAAASALAAAQAAAQSAADGYRVPTTGIPETTLAQPVRDGLNAGRDANAFLNRYDRNTPLEHGQSYVYDETVGLLVPTSPEAADTVDPAFLLRGVVLNEGDADPAGLPAGALRFRRPAAVAATAPIGRGSGSAVTSLPVPTTVDLAVGDYLIANLGASYEDPAATFTVTAAGGGVVLTRAVAQQQGASATAAVYVGRVTAPVPAGTVVTATASSVRSDLMLKLARATGLVTASPVDQTAISGAGAAGAVSVGPTASTSQANELAVAAVVWNPSTGLTFEPAAEWARLGDDVVSLDGTPRTLTVLVRLLSVTGPATAAGTFLRPAGNTTATTAHSAALVTLRAA